MKLNRIRRLISHEPHFQEAHVPLEVAGPSNSVSVFTGMQCPLILCLGDSGPGLKRWTGDWLAQQFSASTSERHKLESSPASTIVRAVSVCLIYEYTTFLDGRSSINAC